MKNIIITLVNLLFPLYLFAGISSGVSSEAPLPVELISFDAKMENNFVLLTWTTATEVNNYGFEIERSSATLGTTSSTDENTNSSRSETSPSVDGWVKIGFVEGHGNSYSLKMYSYIDSSRLSGEINYRLKQIDTDGTFKYSDTVTVSISADQIVSSNKIRNSLFQNHPNPFNPSTIISYQIAKPVRVSLKVYDILGREVAKLVDQKQLPGIYSVEFNKFSSSKSLSSGIYYYQIIAGQYIETKKMLLLK